MESAAAQAADPRSRLAEAAASFDPDTTRQAVNAAEAERKETVELFPLEGWPTMELAEYALGQEGNPDTLSRRIEFQTPNMGSIRGGSARKHIVYKHVGKPGWYFPSEYDNVEQAWEAVRSGFVEAFELAGEGRWNDIDAIEALGPQSLLLKLLYTYFPDEILPICSPDHLRRFVEIAGEKETAADQSVRAVQLNRTLLAAVRGIPELGELSTKALERFLYRRFNPFDPELYKIAPGHDANRWDECLAGGYICLGWNELARDLRSFDSKEEFMEEYHRIFDEQSGRAKATEKGNELWRLMEIQEGDLIAANKGTSKILAVGKVIDPGYYYDEDREDYRHMLSVEWDESYAQEIKKQGRWAFVTIGKIKGELRSTILNRGEDGDDVVSAEALFEQIAESLERRGQAVLYGPPGTGKTWNAERFSRWWLRERNGESGGADADGHGPDFLREWVTFHPSYSYEDFVEGFRPTRNDEGEVVIDLEDGIFKVFCEKAAKDPDRTYLLVIDEINRANIAKVFGELITLIEKDKRGRLAATLPYSKEEFVVPSNVFMLGTMNTADRSIRLLDTALRRRFGFVELMPQIDVLEAVSVEGLALDTFLAKLNQQIVKVVGREKQIGHSFFLTNEQPITDAAEFARIFKQEIVPLLQEYALDDYDTLAELLGPRIVDREAKQLNTELLNNPGSLLEALEEIYGQQDEAAE